MGLFSAKSKYQLLSRWLIAVSFLLRVGFFLFGIYQDTTMEVKYTDVDYLVFTDAARYVYHGQSPYLRETYRYTPLLAYLLVPTAINFEDDALLQLAFFSFGKFIFIISDLVTGILILRVLEHFQRAEENYKEIKSMPKGYKPDDKSQLRPTFAYKNLVLSSIWLLNPMVITISTRGSSESFLTVLLMLFIYELVIEKNLFLSGFFYGLSVHFKIYPVIYSPAVFLYLSHSRHWSIQGILKSVFTFSKVWKFALSCAFSFALVTGAMTAIYGNEFLDNSYFYHFIRTDHRHNFSVYNISLYFRSSLDDSTVADALSSSTWNGLGKDYFIKPLLTLDFTKYAFIPQFLVSIIILPIMFNLNSRLADNTESNRSLLLVITFFFQTFAFVNYNKVMTSQYFIWYLLFLPFFLKNSTLTGTNKVRGAAALAAWVIGQVVWLSYAYQLEFLGKNVFFPGLFAGSLAFFAANSWALGVCIDDVVAVFFK